MFRFTRAFSFVFLVSVAIPAIAADAAADSSEILVTGRRSEYGAKATSIGTKTGTDIRNIPQALTVISAQQIADQQLRSVAELLYFVPGASPGTGESNRDQMTLRGNSSTADFFVDGVRDDVQYMRDFYNVERVEVLKGPNAMIFGRGGGGGIVNRALKQAQFASRRSVTLAGDGFGGLRAATDLGQEISPAFAVRVNGMVEDGDSFRDHVDLKRWGFNPTAAFRPGPNSSIDLSLEHFEDRRTADRGVPADGRRPLEGYDRTFFGDPGQSHVRANVDSASIAVEHRVTPALTLRNRTRVGDYDKFYQNIFGSNLDEATREVVLDAYNSRNDRTNMFNQTDLIFAAPVAGIDQTLLVGSELGRQTSRNRRLSGSFSPGTNRVPLANATVDADVTFAPAPNDADNKTRAHVFAFYAQEQLRPASWIELVAGLRYDRFSLTVDDLRPAVDARFKRRDSLWSPRLGMILKPRDNLSLYGSFSRSFLPQSGDQFSGLTLSTETLAPERFDNLEAGVKWEPVRGLLATAAVYRLDRSNSRAADPADPTRVVLTGKQRSQGIEVGLERSITDRWQVSAGYALQKAEIVETTTAAPAGRKVPLVPRHSLSLWNRYDLNNRVGLGLGLLARSKSFASISNQVTLPGYARLDAAVYYALPNGMEAQLNIENVTGADYFPSAHNDNNIAPGAPRSLRASIGYRF